MEAKPEDENLNPVENTSVANTTENVNLDEKTPVDDTNDKDSYLKRDEFSSEHFKLEVRNLPKNFGFGVL